MTPEPFTHLYVVRCANGEPCHMDASGGNVFSCFVPAGRPTWDKDSAAAAVRRLDAKTPEEAGVNVSQEKWDQLYGSTCGPHFISVYKIQVPLGIPNS